MIGDDEQPPRAPEAAPYVSLMPAFYELWLRGENSPFEAYCSEPSRSKKLVSAATTDLI